MPSSTEMQTDIEKRQGESAPDVSRRRWTAAVAETSTRSRAPDFVAKFSEQTMAKVGDTPKMKKPVPYFAKRAPIVSLAIGSEDCDGLDVRQHPDLVEASLFSPKGQEISKCNSLPVGAADHPRDSMGEVYQRSIESP
jgi:hypothetical protein